MAFAYYRIIQPAEVGVRARFFVSDDAVPQISPSCDAAREGRIAELLIPALDAVGHHTTLSHGGREITEVTAVDGAVAHYDHTQRRAACTCGESPCRHQLAAMLVAVRWAFR